MEVKCEKKNFKNLQVLTAHQRQIFQLFFIVYQAVLHVFLYLVHLQLQIVSMLYELVDVEVLLVFHVDQLRLELANRLGEL